MKLIKTKVADVMSKVISGGEGCIGWMTNIVVTGGERYKSELTSGSVRVKIVCANLKKSVTAIFMGFD